MNKLFTQLLEKRGISDSFLHPKYDDLTSAFDLPDMEKAVERIKTAVKKQEKVLIYGDYDVDGVTASTVMEEALRLAGLSDIQIMLPDRFIDGYGMSPRLIEKAKDTGVTLVVTVDCGSRNLEIVEELNTLGIDSIITDHHECGEELPEAVAVINPKRRDFEKNPDLKELAGVGVAFKVAQALVEVGLIEPGQEKWLLDLVLIGTICDSMLLTGENRILSFYGVKVLEKTRRPGLIELKRSAGVKSITSEAIGFQLGPRLNAAGRLDTATIALDLLRADSHARAAALAEKLENLNKKRRTEQRTAVEEIEKRGLVDGPVIIEVGKWHEGIIGIVAGRLLETYGKPAFVLTEVENGILKGSGRSFGDFNLSNALEYAKDAIIGGGGHAAAAGVRLSSDQLYAFREKITAYYESLHLEDQSKYLKKKPDLTTSSMGDLNLELLDNLAMLEPFGPGNEEPLFELKDIFIESTRHMGDKGQHLRLDVATRDGKSIKCIAFFAPEAWFNLGQEIAHSLIIKPTVNEWQGVRSVEAYLIDVN